jgi:mannitol-1-phosphate 5-dehydrogenase
LTRTFVGIGFGPIQSGLFLLEAFESGNFDRLVVAEVAADVVEAVRRADGRFFINVAESARVRSHEVAGLEIYNPQEAADQAQLVSAIAAADEVATGLPSVEFFSRGSPSPAELLAQGFYRRFQSGSTQMTVVYAAENHNHAAERLRDQVRLALPSEQHEQLDRQVQFVNTVIGKMSGVVSDTDHIRLSGLQPLVNSDGPAVLVEQFNRILIEQIKSPDFHRGLNMFQMKPDLLPFEEAKLYGHNAAHALMGFLAHRRGLRFMSEARDGDLLELVESAFLHESGTAICRRHASVDPLFTETGWKEYVRDLLQRMTNPHLQDQVARVIRDPRRKLGWDDRLIGTMRLAIQHGVEPQRYALGAAAALQLLQSQSSGPEVETLLTDIWSDVETSTKTRGILISLIREALDTL